MVKRVSELKNGEMGCVFAIERKDTLGIRLLELGFTPGTWIRFLRCLSRQGTVEISVRGSRLLLGLSEAKSILVHF